MIPLKVVLPQHSKIKFQKSTSVCMLGLFVLISNCFAVIVDGKIHQNDLKDWIRSKLFNTMNNVIATNDDNVTSAISDCKVECTMSDAQPEWKTDCDVLPDLQRYCTNETTLPAKKPACSLKCSSNDTTRYCSYVRALQRECDLTKNKTVDLPSVSITSRSLRRTPTAVSPIAGFSLMVNDSDKFNECSANIRCTKADCCSTPSCMEIAKQMCAVMDVKGEPCEDFHRFSCGGLAPDFNIADIISDQVHKLISEQRNSYVFLEAVNGLKNYYKSCLDEDEIRSGSLEYVQRLIYSLGGWGVLQNTSYNDKFSEFNWNTYVQRWIKYGVYPDDLLFFDFENHNESNDKRNISVLPPRLSLPADILLEGKENKMVKAYFAFMKDVATLLGADTKTVDKEMEEILNLEINLAHAKAEFENEHVDDISTVYEESAADMTHRFPAINWWAYLINFCHNLKQSECFLKHYGAYKMKKLVDVITQASERLLNNYVVWKAIAKVSVFASPQINEIFHKHFDNESVTFAGTYIDKKCVLSKGRWMCNCIEITKRTFSKALNYLYANRYFDEISNQAVLKAADRIKDYFVAETAQWKSDKQQTEFVKNKLTNLTNCFYDDLTNMDELRLYYSSVPVVNATNFLYWFQTMNLFHATKYVARRANETATKRMNSTCEGKFYIDSSIGRYHGAYLPWEATSFVGLRIMQSTQFDPYLPEYINLARIGFYIARLMALVIFKADPNDEYLSLRENASLWDMKIMMKNDICVKKQSSELSLRFQDEKMSSKFISSRATMEVILDDIAFTAAYDTYVASLKNKKIEKHYLLVPGFENFTVNEIFWMNFATTICQLRDELDMSRVRVLMAATKHDEFRTDYVCSKNSKMNSRLQCPDLWSLLKEENK